MRANIVLIFCVSILLGILLPFFIDFNFNESLLFLVLAFTFFVLLVFKTNANKKYLLFFFTVFLGLFLGCLSTVNTSNKNSILLEKNLNKKIKVEGVVDDFPDERQGHTFLVVKVEDKNFHTNERIILTTPIYPKHYFGERVQIEGKLEQPVNTFKNKEGDLDNQVFSYRGYLSKDNIYTSMYYPSIETVESPKKSVKYFLYNFKTRCIKIVQEYIKDPASGLLVGILFGVKQALGSDILSEFTKAGVVHIVVLSGYNIALIVSASLAFFSRTPLHVKYFLTYISIFVFIIFVGGGSSVVRAGLMASIALFARQTGRDSDAITILFIATAGIALYEPRSLMYDPGLHLSVLATFGLIFLTPKINKYLSFLSEKFLLREVVSTTLATQLTVTPYLLFYMGKVSVVGLISNIFIVPLVPMIMLVGFTVILIGLIYLPASLPFALILSALLNTVLTFVHFVAGIPFAQINFSISFYAMVSIYILYFLFFVNSKVTS